MKLGLFVTGTDTGVGKTLVSAALVRVFAQRGYRAAGLKPVASGCRREVGGLVSEDAELLRASANVELPETIVNPYAFEPPVAPHIAAQRAGRVIDLDRIRHAYSQAAQLAEVLVVEGVGGFRVPLNDDQDTADLAVALGLPVVLVVGMRLGCLNHALLTAEAILARGLSFAGWVANCVDPGMPERDENIGALHRYMPAPCIGVIPFRTDLNVQFATESLEYDKFLIRVTEFGYFR